MLQAAVLNYTLAETQWEIDWTTLLSLANQPGSSLEQIHIFALSHIMRRVSDLHDYLSLTWYCFKFNSHHRHKQKPFIFKSIHICLFCHSMFSASSNESENRFNFTSKVNVVYLTYFLIDLRFLFFSFHSSHQPIIVYGVKFVKSFRGEDIGYARFEGLYLPLLWEQSFCIKSPIALGYTRGHFSALVPTEPYSRIDAARDDSEDVTFLPLMDCEQKLLPIHFLTQNEV